MSPSELIHKISIWSAPRLQNAMPNWIFREKPLRFRAYCIGAPKTGTTMIGKLFSYQYRSAHEPEASLALAKILKFIENDRDSKTVIDYLKHRDIRLGLEMDSSHLNYPILDILLNEYKDAKFILTIRDCYSWLDSLLNHHFPIYSSLGHKKEFQNRKWIRFNKYLFKPHLFQYEPEEKILQDNYLYPLSGYLSYWAEHNKTVISKIPQDRLLIIKTKDLEADLTRIENFIGIPQNSLPKNVWENKRNSIDKLNLLSKIDRSFLEKKVNQYCQDLMVEYFPEIPTAKDGIII